MASSTKPKNNNVIESSRTGAVVSGNILLQNRGVNGNAPSPETVKDEQKNQNFFVVTHSTIMAADTAVYSVQN